MNTVVQMQNLVAPIISLDFVNHRYYQEILEIRSESSSDWNKKGIRDYLRICKKRVCIVAKINNPIQDRSEQCAGRELEEIKVVGFTIYDIHRFEFEIRELMVCPNYRRRGIGKKMVEQLISWLSGYRQQITALVKEYNLGAQVFFRSVGFRYVKTLRNLYNDDDDKDTYLMRYLSRS